MSKGKDAIAIVGVGCKLPGNINNIDQLWDVIANGSDCLTKIPADRWDCDTVASKEFKLNNRLGGFIDNIDQFDAQFFGMSPKEASQIDPQQRLVLQVAMEALEDAKMSFKQIKGTNTGVFIGSSSSDYLRLMSMGDINQFTTQGTNSSFLSNRLSYFLDITGPSLTVNTACSSSLVAIHLGAQSIWKDECRVAIVGGVNIIANQIQSLDFGKAGLLNTESNGRCYSFDERASGYVRAEGAGILILKNLSDAIKDRDEIHSIILNSGTNQNGQTPQGITSPNSSLQQVLLNKLMEGANVLPKDIGYFECHGTGTQMGDANETEAIGNSIGSQREVALPVGSIKSNLGHLEGASGVVGLLKTIACIKNKKIAPICPAGFKKLNPKINFDQLNINVPTEVLDWNDEQRLAIVNSFGVGGSNSSVLLTNYQHCLKNSSESLDTNSTSSVSHMETFTVSVNTNDMNQLKQRVQDMIDYIETNFEHCVLKDICYTSNVRTNHYANRVSFMVESLQDLKEKMQIFVDSDPNDSDKPKTIYYKDASATSLKLKKLAFVCSGQGQQWINMGKELYESSPIYRAEFMKCSSLFQALSGWSIIDKLYDPRNTDAINDTWLAQPAIFATQIGICAVLKKAGITPSTVIGHSLGEVVGVYLAGILSLEDSIKLIWHRSHLQNKTTGTGSMCIALTSKENILAIAERYAMGNQIAIAGNNSSKCVGLSGSTASMETFMNILKDEKVINKKISINAGFHSYLMDTIKDEFYSLFPNITHQTPKIPYYSTTTGKLIDENNFDILGVDYWWSNLRETVMFKEALFEMVDHEEFDGFIELTAHPIISFFLKHMIAEKDTKHFYLATMSRESSNIDTLMELYSNLYVDGYNIGWESIYTPRQHLAVKLPGRRWNMDRYWVESTQSKVDRIDLPKRSSITRKLVSLNPSFEIRLDNPRFFYLADHLIQKQVICPYALFLEVVYAAMDELKDQLTTPMFEVLDLEIKSALEIDSKFSNVLQINFNSSLTSFEIGSIIDSSVPIKWNIHATGKVAHVHSIKLNNVTPNPIIEAINSSTKQMNGSEFYSSIARLGYNYGPSFQAVKRVAILDNLNQVSELCLPQTTDLTNHSTSDFAFIHPSMMDGVFQSCFAPLETKKEGLWIPQTFKKMSIDFNSQVDIRVPLYSITKITSHKDKTTFICDITIAKENGETICQFDGMTMKCIARPVDQELNNDLSSQLWKYQWAQCKEGNVDINQMKLDGHHMNTLIFTSDESSQTVKSLADYLKHNYQVKSNNIVIVKNGDKFTSELTDNGNVLSSPLTTKNSNDYVELFGKLKEINQTGTWSIIVLPDLFKPNAHKPTTESVEDSYAQLLFILQQATHCDFTGRMTLVTKHGQAIQPSDKIDYTQYSLIGMIRVYANENSNIYCSMIDVDDETPATAWLDELSMYESKAEVVYREGKRYSYDFINKQSLRQKHISNQSKEARRFQVEISDNGVISDMKIVETKRHQPKAGQVEVKVDITSLNFRDILKTLGRDYDSNHITTIGDEFAGTITAVGESVSNLQVGDKVFGINMSRSMCSYMTCSSDLVFPVPNGLTGEEACTIPITFLTAWYSIVVQANLQKGESILIHSAAGGVGLSAVQIAKHIGAEIFVTVGTADKRKYMEETIGIPSTHIMNSRDDRFYTDIMNITNQRGVDVVLNSLSGDLIEKSILSLANYGRFVEIGKKDIYADSKIGLLPFRNNLSYLAVDVAQMTVNRIPYLAQLMKSTLIPLFESKNLTPLPTNTFTIGHVVQSVRHMSTGNHIGKNLVSWSDLEKSETVDLPLTLVSDSTYIITGTGGLALSFAQKLVDLNVRHLVLASRNGADTDYKKRCIQQLVDAGVSVDVKKCDLSDYQQVHNLLSEFANVKGIFHTAGTLSDHLLHDHTLKTFNGPVNSKCTSAMNLHNASMDLKQSLDYFVVCGSVITPFGKVGQSNYALANRFVEGLTLDRISQGLAATCIHLAPIPEVGMSSDESIAFGLNGVGFTMYDSLQSMNDGICQILSPKCVDPVISYCDLKLNKWMAAFPQYRGKKSISGSIQNMPTTTSPTNLESNNQTSDTPSSESVEQTLKEILSDIMEVKVEKIDSTSNLKDLGLDSLLASELSNSIHKKFNIFVPSLSLLDRKACINTIIEKINPKETSVAKSAEVVEKKTTTTPKPAKNDDEMVRKTIEKIVNKSSVQTSNNIQKKEPIFQKPQQQFIPIQPVEIQVNKVAVVENKPPLMLEVPAVKTQASTNGNTNTSHFSSRNNTNPFLKNIDSAMTSTTTTSTSTTPIILSPSMLPVGDSKYVSGSSTPLLPPSKPLLQDDYVTAIYAVEPLAAPYPTSQERVFDAYKDHTSQLTFMKNVYKNCKIKERYTYINTNDFMGLNALPSSEKNSMFATIVHDTIIKAGERIIQKNNIDRSKISHVIGVTSTGILAPSIDAILCRELNLEPTVGRTMINFMGCGAAVIALRNAVAQAVKRPDTYVLVMCVESSTTNMDIDPNDRGDIVSSCIFSDGCAATLVTCQSKSNLVGKLQCVDDVSYLMKDSQTALEMFMGDRGIDLSLRPELSSCIERNIKPTIDSFLGSHGLEVQDMEFWAVHPGGRKILEAVHNGLNLGAEELAESYEVMKWYGNMVSCSAIYVLKRIIEKINNLKNENGKGLQTGMIMAFSPGASIEAMLLKMIK